MQSFTDLSILHHFNALDLRAAGGPSVKLPRASEVPLAEKKSYLVMHGLHLVMYLNALYL